MSIAVIDYQSGNLKSMARALEKVVEGKEKVFITNSAQELAQADRIVLPGVGAFADCKKNLAALPDLLETLETLVLKEGRPFLGVCVGMQLLASKGLEQIKTSEETAGLNWIPGTVEPFALDTQAYKIPHMGWNTVEFTQQHPLFKGLGAQAYFYFAHSYIFNASKKETVLGQCVYGKTFPVAVGAKNWIGVQFHPEKSQKAGLALLKNFVHWAP